MKKFANVNKIYLLLMFWVLWLFFVTDAFSGTALALIMFLIGFGVSGFGIVYIADNPNEKEKKTLEKLSNLFSDN